MFEANGIESGYGGITVLKGLEFEVGDQLVVNNEDDVVHNVGPYVVGPHQSITQTFSNVGRIEGLCSLHPSGEVTIVVR